jgi:hypothetical protein
MLTITLVGLLRLAEAIDCRTGIVRRSVGL